MPSTRSITQGTHDTRADPLYSVALIGLAGALIELWMRRDSYHLVVTPMRFVLYGIHTWMLFTLIALTLRGVARLGAIALAPLFKTLGVHGVSNWISRMMFLGFLFCIPLVPILLKHIGLRSALHPDAYFLGLLLGLLVVSTLATSTATYLGILLGKKFGAGTHPAMLVLLLVTTLLGCRILLAVPGVKLIALNNTTFAGQISSFLIRAMDLDRDGVPGRLVGGADPDDFDPGDSFFSAPGNAEHPPEPSSSGAQDPMLTGTDPSRLRNVILVTVDTFRPDHLGAYGYPRATSENFDRLAEQGFLFTNTRVPVGQSNPSFATIFTGYYPHSHGLLAGEWNGRPKKPYLWDYLRKTHDTLAFCYSHKSFCSPGGSTFSAGAGEVVTCDDYELAPRSLFDWIDRERDAPFLVWIYHKAPHKPNRIPPLWDRYESEPDEPISRFESPRSWQKDARSTRTHRMIDVYDGALTYVDAAIGELWNHLEQSDLAEETVVVVVGDHGEAFFEHDRFGHGQECYEEHLQVPLLIVGGRVPHGSSDGLTSTADIVPTLLDLLGVSTGRVFEGRSVVPLFSGHELPPIEFLPSFAGYDLGGGPYYDKVAATTGSWKLVYSPTLNIVELYDLERDPKELSNVADHYPDVTARLLESLRNWEGFQPLR